LPALPDSIPTPVLIAGLVLAGLFMLEELMD
jgi:hypothetical protein